MNLYKDLIVFEMANNHQGDVEHGLRIIKEMGVLVKKYKLNGTVKLQYRQLDSFIHPVKRQDKSIHYIQRFLSTELSNEDFKKLVDATKNEGMRSMVTPFDEASVDVILSHGVDIVKVASCSADDWPLLEKIAAAGKPVLASTGGLSMPEIDNLVSFFTHRVSEFGLMHCVSIYPTPNNLLHIGFLEKLIKRYPSIPIGWSGHEPPTNNLVAQIAVSKGAQMLERHVGVPTNSIKLNAYSMNPSEVDLWLEAIEDTKDIIGDGNKYVTQDEKKSLLDLKRGVFAKRDLKKNELLSEENCYFAFPCEEGQLTSGEFGKLRAKYSTSKAYKKDQALFETTPEDTYHQVRTIIHEAKGMLAEANVVLSLDAQIELSHHFGLSDFRNHGCLLVSMVNREYCKKIIVVFPNQSHPEQYHVKKEETFHILWGDLTLTLNGIKYTLKKGDIKTLERGVRHSFISENGCIFEEISSTHYRSDSFYLDPKIDEQDPMARKTVIDFF
jgi:sialic acid synthase SpsE/mannose-6-phosphate isomerase-like protein (cupin superfamily)